jgi:DNA-binding CsgD family transcriptional regulator
MPPRAATLPLLVLRGDWSEARQLAEITRANGSPVERQLAATLLGALARYQGDQRLAWTTIFELLPAGPSTDPGGRLFPCALEMQRLAIGLALDDGELLTARSWLEAHDRWLAWGGALRGQSESQILWAAYRLADGDITHAHRHASAALEQARSPRQPLAELAAHRLLGQIDTIAERFDLAEVHLEAAEQLAVACAAPHERALVLLARARLDVAAGRPDQARSLLSQAEIIGTELGATPLLSEVTSLLTQCPQTDDQMRYPAHLSTREVEVLRLVAEGLTDTEVAERLFISPRTVGQHLRSIYNKLGVSSRAAATRFAVEQGLT